MNAYLLDTHVLVWLCGNSTRLSPGMREELADPRVTRLVSAVSAMEIATKCRLGNKKMNALPGLDVRW